MIAGDLRDHMWAFIMQGEDLPYATNTVDLSPSIRDARGYPVARVTYEPGRHELAASKHHGKILQRVLEEMGAEYVIHTSSPGVSYHGIGATPIPESRHVIGTARMGDNPDTAVCDRWGRVHECDNVDRRRLVGLRDRERLRAHPHPGRAGLPGGAPPGGLQADGPRARGRRDRRERSERRRQRRIGELTPAVPGDLTTAP